MMLGAWVLGGAGFLISVSVFKGAANLMTLLPICLTWALSCASTAINPSAMTAPSIRAICGCSPVGWTTPVIGCCTAIQFGRPPNLSNTPKISLGTGTTTPSIRLAWLGSLLTSMWGAGVAEGGSAKRETGNATSAKARAFFIEWQGNPREKGLSERNAEGRRQN